MTLQRSLYPRKQSLRGSLIIRTYGGSESTPISISSSSKKQNRLSKALMTLDPPWAKRGQGNGIAENLEIDQQLVFAPHVFI